MVFLVHCLCPQGHSLLTVAVEGTEARAVEADIRATILTMIEAGTCAPQCVRCQAPAQTWTTEVIPTHFRTLAEAEAVLREQERHQRVTAALVKGVDEVLAKRGRTR